jgi:hypothetical protein
MGLIPPHSCEMLRSSWAGGEPSRVLVKSQARAEAACRSGGEKLPGSLRARPDSVSLRRAAGRPLGVGTNQYAMKWYVLRTGRGYSSFFMEKKGLIHIVVIISDRLSTRPGLVS